MISSENSNDSLGLEHLFSVPENSISSFDSVAGTKMSGDGDKKVGQTSTAGLKANVVRLNRSTVARVTPRKTVAAADFNDYNVVRGGKYADDTTCDSVWTAALDVWDLTNAKDGSTEDLLQKVAQACFWATSGDEDNLDKEFKYNNRWYPIRVLADKMQEHFPGPGSPLRRFIRSYGGGQIPLIIFMSLADPANISARQEVAYRVGCDVNDAKYGFDTAEALIGRCGLTLTGAEIMKIRSYRAIRTTGAQVQAQSVGDNFAANDVSGKRARETRTVAAPTTLVSMTAARERANFASVRG